MPPSAESSSAERKPIEPTPREPSTTDTGAAEPGQVEPTAAKATSTDAAEAVARPIEAAPAEPSGVEPSAAEPTAVEPSAAEPTAVEPSAAEPSAADVTSVDAEPDETGIAETAPDEHDLGEAGTAKPDSGRVSAVEEISAVEETRTEPADAPTQGHAPASTAPEADDTLLPVASAAEWEERSEWQETSEQALSADEERTEPWAKLIANPGHAPELLALAAVQTFGPRARDWAEQTREAYPTASDHALARLAVQQFTRFGGLTSIFGAVAGSYAPVALLGTSAITHAEMVLHLAAAYGLDPTDPERAADLLVITRAHPTRADAEAALASARRPAYEDGGISGAVWRLGRMVAAQSGAWTVVRLANRFLPGVSLLAAALTGNASAQTIAARATSYYRAGHEERSPAGKTEG